MPGTSLPGARIVAERCRAHSIEARACDGGVRLGFGVVAAVERGEAGVPPGIDETPAQILARAAAALALDTAPLDA